MALWSLVLLVSGAATGPARAHDIPITVMLSTSVGCGSAAVYEVGEGTAYTFSVDRDSLIVLRLQRPDGVIDLLSNFAAKAGVTYEVTGVAGSVLGPRTVTVFATAPGASGQAVCSYTVVGRGEDRSIGVTLTTNKGCGSSAVFRAGEAINISYSVDRTSFVVLKLVGPSGTQLLKNNDVATAGILNAVTVTAGATGNYTLILDAGAGGRSGHIECTFRVEAHSVVTTLTTDRGCGTGALYHTGDAVNITYSTDRDALVVLKLVGPGGTQLLKDNAVSNAGVLNSVTVTAGAPGDYTLILDAAAEGRTGHSECTFRVEAPVTPPSTGEIAVTLTTNRGCGSSAVFRAGDAINLTFSTDRTAFVVLKLVGPGGTQVLLDNFVANGGQTYPITVTAGATGSYTLILDAGVEGRSGHIECTLTVNPA